MADITLANLNMLYVRYRERAEREQHLPLGPLYLAGALERAGFTVDFRDLQTFASEDPFSPESLATFFHEPAAVVGVSCMANLLPFAILALREVKARYPDRTLVLGGVGPASVEEKILERFPWIDIVARGEGELSAPLLLRALRDGAPLAGVPGITFRDGEGRVVSTPRPPRLENLDDWSPAFHHVNVADYQGYNVVSSRGCPYPCTFCSVAPIWDRKPALRSFANVIEEMRRLYEEAGVRLFLFQDEFFVASKERARRFSEELIRARLPVQWKAFGRVDLTDDDTVKSMADSGCVELRYGIESGDDEVLRRIRKGFTAEEALDRVSRSVGLVPRVDAFYIWGFPFEDQEAFQRTLFHMLTVRLAGARILPSLLCFLPQTPLYEEYRDAPLEFCAELLPEYMTTGHETYLGARVDTGGPYGHVFTFIREHPDLFPGFFHYDLQGNVLPKLEMLMEFGFYTPGPAVEEEAPESCGAHSPHVAAPGPLGTISRGG